MKLRITQGSGWYSDKVGEVLEVTGRHENYSAYYVKVWNENFNRWESDTHWVHAVDYEIIEENVMSEKPLLGIMPRDIWITKRILDIVTAIDRYVGAGKEIPLNWVEEYNELIKTKEEKG